MIWGCLRMGGRWLKESYFVEPLVLPELVQNQEEEIKQYIVEALTAFNEGGGRKYMFTKIDTEVIFNRPYQFRGYNT